jgi:hypothetical protein
MSESLDKFEKWFATPIRQLTSIENGDGSFVMMSVSFSLFERFVKSDLIRSETKADPCNFFKRAAAITNVEEPLFKLFWGMYRDGIQHYLQPKTFKTKGVQYGWSISHKFGAMPSFIIDLGIEKTIGIDPSKWTNFVLKLYENDPEILDIMESHSLGGIYHHGMGDGGSFLTTYGLLPLFLCDNLSDDEDGLKAIQR